jgi:hypothetical protein
MDLLALLPGEQKKVRVEKLGVKECRSGRGEGREEGESEISRGDGEGREEGTGERGEGIHTLRAPPWPHPKTFPRI